MALDVVVRMSAQEAGAYRAWLEQQKAVGDTAHKMDQLAQAAGGAKGKVDDLEQRLTAIANSAGRAGEKTGAASRKMGDLTTATGQARAGMNNFFNASLGRWLTLAGGIGAATSGLHKIIAALKQVKQEESQTTVSLDEQFRRFATQAQLSDQEFPRAQEVFFRTARAEAAPVELVVEAAKQLVSSGFSKEEVLKGGGALREMVMAIKATTAEGKDFDVTAASESITQFIMAQVKPEDRALTTDNLRKTLRATQGLYVQRNIQFADLTELAKAAPALSGAGIDTITQLAMFTKLRDTLDAEQSATSLRNLVIRMTTAGTSKTKVAALAQLGLTPEDVDLEGEDIDTALARMKVGLDKLSPSAGTAVLKELFEERGMLGARTLIENFEQISQYRGEALDPTRFATAHSWATGGVHAAEVRSQIDKQQARFMGEGALQQLIAEQLEARIPGAQGVLTRKAFEELAPVLGTKEALVHAVPNATEARFYFRSALEAMESTDVLRGSRPISAEGARPFDREKFEADETRLAAQREQAIERAKTEAEQQQRGELIGRQGAGGSAARRLVLAEASRELERDSFTHDPEELAQIQGRATAEALAADLAVSTGRIAEFGPAEAAELHRRMDKRLPRGAYAPGEAVYDQELHQRIEDMIRVLEQIRDEKHETQPVRIENPGEPQRYARRSKASQPPSGRKGPKGFQGMGVGG